MAICRIEKTKNYTTMSNYHLDDKNLSLKAIGLLSKMLRLPDNWDFSIKGLAAICKDGADSISSALKELEKNHYIKRERERDEAGYLRNMIYYVYEVPYTIDKSTIEKSEFVSKKEAGETLINKGVQPKRENPVLDNPVLDNPSLENPNQETPNLEEPNQVCPNVDEPILENQPQINTNRELNTKQAITNQPNTFQTNTNSFLINQSINPEIDETEMNERLNDLKEQFNFKHIQYVNQLLDEQLEEGNIELDDYDEKWINLEYAESILLGLAESLSYPGDKVIVQNNSICGKSILMDKIKLLNEFDFKKIIKTVYDIRPKNKQLYAIKTIYNY